MADYQTTLSSILDKMEPYDGKDPNLIEKNICKRCGENSEKNEEIGDANQTFAAPLLRCSRCKLVYYCSKECQKLDFADHKKICKRVHSLTQTCKEEASKLRSSRDLMFGPAEPENLFTEHVGSFWGLVETRDYMRSRLELADTILYGICWYYKTKESWEAVLEHYQEMLRLCMGDNLGLRYTFPFLLLYLNRDDDAFAFIRYWLQDYEARHDERELMHSESNEGDWIYGREQDCRFLDIFEECPSETNENHWEYASLPLLVATACIKMRLITAFEAQQTSMTTFSSTRAGNSLHAVKSLISDNLIGDKSWRSKMQAQRDQLNRLLDQIDANNPTMLPSLLNPGPLLSQPEPQYHSRGTPSECFHVLKVGCGVWARIPRAKEMLAERFGTAHPAYTTDLDEDFS